ncbi:hypothetical protein [Sorangium atrum]|uniref:HTH cro/C1-type domain-containing protein n=1 Tax=Sorangium atrum TaxID=2995308 RepID=A0ABT5C1S6_9BACT|nr:hypothetical protein [Sorangium aterium]MDC0680372.1 hypothetical protein [Sorangium aterium]
MRTRAAVDLEAWAEARGGVRAAAREIGIASPTLSRWISGQRTPADDGELSKAWIETQTGVKAAGWNVLVDQAAPPSPPPVKASTGRRAPSPSPRPRRPPSQPSRAPAATASPPELPPAEPEPPEPPASLEELKRRARAIPGEIRRLRGRVERGDVAVSACETIRRLLTDERAAAIAAIEADGTATVAEVEQLRALVLDVTRGCEGCRARVAAALKERAA